MFAGLQNEGINVGYEIVKKTVHGYTDKVFNPKITNFSKSYDLAIELAENKDIQETIIKQLVRSVNEETLSRSSQTSYRSTKIPSKPNPEIILAEITEFLDWLNTMEAREEHPIIIAAITYFYILRIYPFEQNNKWTAYLMASLVMNSRGYSYKNWLNLQDMFYETAVQNEKLIRELEVTEPDYTRALEYFSDQLADCSSNVAEKVKLLAKDTKIAKASGRARLTERQERIIEYLQDYGILKNKEFPTLFPKISEDTVLRDLKVLLDEGLIIKAGSTKSSRYELK